MKGNERISVRVREIVGRAAGRAQVSVERVRELVAIAFSNITKAVTWGPSVQVREEKDEGGQRVKIVTALFHWSPGTSSMRTRPPPLIRPHLKWSDLRYVFDIQEDCNG